MGEHSEELAATRGGSEVSGIGSSKTHSVSLSTSEDRGGAASEVGEDTGAGEESGVVA
ncbi:MAG TPA: hypothetical protein VN946_21965 [Terriglobales bacterium]|jgi:hypothetical protein|nr:hypothetical protein [Terriglobales bacterium]